MLKKLTNEKASRETREFEERTANIIIGCKMDCVRICYIETFEAVLQSLWY